MAKLDYSTLVARQRDYFLAGNTRPVSWRTAQLEALRRDNDVEQRMERDPRFLSRTRLNESESLRLLSNRSDL